MMVPGLLLSNTSERRKRKVCGIIGARNLHYLGCCLNRLETRCNLLNTGRESCFTTDLHQFGGLVAHLVEFSFVLSQIDDQHLFHRSIIRGQECLIKKTKELGVCHCLLKKSSDKGGRSVKNTKVSQKNVEYFSYLPPNPIKS